MKKIITCLLLITVCFGSLMAQKNKSSKKAKKTDVEVEMPPPPKEELSEMKIGSMPDSSVNQPISAQTGFSKSDFFFNNVDTTSPPNDSLTYQLRDFLNLTGALNLGVQFAKISNRDKNNDILPTEFYDRMYKELSEGDFKRHFENLVIKIYRKYFTLADARNLLQFYNTETGKKTLAMMPSALTEVQELGAGIGRMLGMKIYNDLLKEGKIK